MAQLFINGELIELKGSEINSEQDLARRVNDRVAETGVSLERDGNGGWAFVSNRDFDLEFVAEGSSELQVGGQRVGEGLGAEGEGSGGLRVERGITLSTEVGGNVRIEPGEGGSDEALGEIGLKRREGEDSYTDIEADNFTVGGTNAVEVKTRDEASNTILAIDFALQKINSERADLGAIQNRFDATINNLNISSENLSASRSRILDADFAEETAELTRTKILQQAGTSVLSQANEMPRQVLQLLQQ